MPWYVLLLGIAVFVVLRILLAQRRVDAMNAIAFRVRRLLHRRRGAPELAHDDKTGLYPGASDTAREEALRARYDLGPLRATREVLDRTPAVVLRRTASWRFVDRRGDVVEVRPSVRFAVNDPRAAVDVAREALGLVIAPVEAAEGLVRIHPPFGEPAPVVLYLVYPSQRRLPRRVRLTIDWLLERSPE